MDLIDIGKWLGKKMEYHQRSSFRKVKGMQVNQGEVWECDFGYNIGEEKNKKRPAVVLSNNKVNRTGKVIVAPITDAKGKMNAYNLPQQNTWYLLHCDSTDTRNWYDPLRVIPRNAIQYNLIRKDSVIQCEELRSVSKVRLVSKKGNIDTDDFLRLKTKISNTFDI